MMDWRRVRHLASGALLAGSLFSGATVGSVVLLGDASHRGDPVGRLSAHLASDSLAAEPSYRGARAIALHAPKARGARAVARRAAAKAAKAANLAAARTTHTVAHPASVAKKKPASRPATTVTIVNPATTVTVKKPATKTSAPTTTAPSTPTTQPTTVTTTPVTTTRPNDDWVRTATGTRRTSTERPGQVEPNPGPDDAQPDE